MTTPVIPPAQFIDVPGVGERIGQAIEPFLAMLKERKDRAERQQQLMTQLGQLKLQQDQFADEQKQRNALKKGLEGQVKEIAQSMAKNEQEVGPIEKRLGELAGTGNPETFWNGIAQMRREQSDQRTRAIQTQYAQMARHRGTPLTEEERIQMHSDIVASDPTNPMIQGQVGMANALRGPGGQGPVRQVRGESIRQLRQQFPGMAQGMAIDPAKMYHVQYEPGTGRPIAVMGEATANWTDRLNAWGDVKQRDSSGFGLRLHNGLANVVKLTRNREDVREEMERAITIIETAGTLPLNLDDISQRLTQMSVNGQISEDGQIATNSMFDVLAARAQQGAGLTLPAHEWAIQVRAIAPLVGDKPGTFNDKITRLWKERERLLRQGGPATDLIRDLLVPFTWGAEGAQPDFKNPPSDTVLDKTIREIVERLRKSMTP